MVEGWCNDCWKHQLVCSANTGKGCILENKETSGNYYEATEIQTIHK
jgi:hypothetical protein